MLHRPIDDFQVSENFQLDFLRAGFSTLADALEHEADWLIKEKKFSYHTITELIILLNSHGLAQFFKD
jgi:hypothetical protein